MELANIKHSIAKARFRVLLKNTIQAGSYVLPTWAAAASMSLLIAQLAPSSAIVFQTAIPILAVLGLIGCFAYGAREATSDKVAAKIDRLADLKDRLTNAREFAAKTERSPLMELAIADAEAVAAEIESKSLFPVWIRGNGKRFATLLLLLPLIYLAAAINFVSLFGEKPTPDLLDTIVIPDELADDGFRDLPASATLLPAGGGLRGMIGTWRERLAELRERARLAAASIPQEEPELPETIYREDMERQPAEQRQQILAADGLPAVRQDDELHLSDLRALGRLDPELDSSMRMAFSQLDEIFLEQDPNLEDVEAYVEHLGETSAEAYQSGSSLAMSAGFGSQMGTDNDPQGGFRTSTQGAQQQSFNEFLNQYSQHLGRVAAEKQKITGERKKRGNQGQNQQVLVSDQGQQLPPDAQMRMIQVTPEMMAELKLNTQMGQHVEPGGGNQMRAGQGGGTYRGAIKVKHEELQNTNTVQNLQGQVGEGHSSVQILEDADDNALETYSRLYNEFKEDAQVMMDDATIPISIRSYVQRYLESISPSQVKKPKPQ